MRAGQNAMQFAVLDQNAASLRSWRVARSTEANSEVLHLVEDSIRDLFVHDGANEDDPASSGGS